MAVATNTLKPQLLKLKKGEYVFEEGDEAVFAYVLTEGVIEIVATSKGEEQVLAKLEKGTIFGEMAILDGEARSANALAQENCELIAIQRSEFLRLLRRNFKISFALMGELAKRLRKSDQQIEALSLSDAEHRIGVSVLNLAEDMGVIRKGQVTIEKLPFQQDIANMSGTSRETVSRVLKLFEDRNMITKIGHTVVIPDYAFFKRLFDKTV